jgi:hypothetical protein
VLPFSFFSLFIWFISPSSLFYLHFYVIYFPSFLLLLFIPLSWKKLHIFTDKISRLHRLTVNRCTVYSGSVT